MLGLLVMLGFVGGFLSGLVGVGGAIIMIPLLLYVPPLLGLEDLGIKAVAGITIVQVFAASVVGLVGHRESIDRSLLLTLAVPMVLASLIAALASDVAPPIILSIVLGLMATSAAAILVVFRKRTAPEIEGVIAFNRPAAILAGIGVGLAAGLVGAGGTFFLIPIMLYGLRIPVRTTVGTSLAVVAASSAAALVGKFATGQIDWALAVALVIGAIPGARLGAWVSHRTATDRLVVVLAGVVACVAIVVWVDVVGELSSIV
jgi:uncharacterized membrane protein YfcA